MGHTPFQKTRREDRVNHTSQTHRARPVTSAKFSQKCDALKVEGALTTVDAGSDTKAHLLHERLDSASSACYLWLGVFAPARWLQQRISRTSSKLTVAFPHLRRIEIEAAAIFADNFLRHLELASTTSIHLRCYVYGIEGSLVASPTDIVDSLVSSILGDVLQSIHALYIHEDGDRYDDHVVVRGFVDAQLGDLDQLPELEARLSLSLRGEKVADETEDLDEIGDHVQTEIYVSACAFLGAISAGETFSGIEILHIDTRNGPDWHELRSSLHNLNNVKKAILSGESGDPNVFIESLGEVHSPECIHGGTLLLPRLEELSWKFAEGDDIENDTLLDVLTTRRDHGVPLRKLRLVAECNGENFTIEDIAESVRSVVEEVIVVSS